MDTEYETSRLPRNCVPFYPKPQVQCLAMNLYLLPVYDLVVMQVLTAQEDLDYYKVTIENSYLMVSNGINGPIL